MDWPAYRDRIESAEYRYNVPALFTDADDFAAFVDDLLDPYNPGDVDQVAGIDALGAEENETPWRWTSSTASTRCGRGTSSASLSAAATTSTSDCAGYASEKTACGGHRTNRNGERIKAFRGGPKNGPDAER